MSKSKMAAKIQDGGRKLWVLSTRIFSLAYIYHHAKNYTCAQMCNWSAYFQGLAAGLVVGAAPIGDYIWVIDNFIAY